MAPDTPLADQDDPDARWRPVWEDTPDETDADLRPPGQRPAPDHRHRAEDQPGLLATLADATDALARLDARAAAADEAIRDGVIARLAFTEAAGWLAHSHAWVHPLDLALRDLGLAASLGLVATGSARALPHTVGAGQTGWDDQPLDDLPTGARAVGDALVFAGVLRRLSGTSGANPFGDRAAAAARLASLGAGDIDPVRFAAWWEAHAGAPAQRRTGPAGAAGPSPLPPLLAAARAAQDWMEDGPTDRPEPLHALLAAFGRMARSHPARTVFVPLWSAYPAAGFGDRDALPTLRSDAAGRIAGWGRPVTWPLACLHLVAESARMGLRELERLTALAGKGRGLAAAVDKRARLPDAIDALLRVPALTPRALAARLKVAPQTATAWLRALEGSGLAREVTGRGSFRAFAL